MSRTLNGTLSTDLEDQVLTLCRCWEITKNTGDILRLTDHDQDLTFLGETYLSDGGFTISALESGENLSVDNTELKVLLKTAVVTQEDILTGVFDRAEVKIWLVNFENTANYTRLPGAYLSKMNGGDIDTANFELMSVSNKLNQSTGRIVIPTCDADFGDARCGVNLASFTVTGTLTSVQSSSIFTDTSRGEADDYFNYGKITFTSGVNSGRSSEVKAFSSGEFELRDSFPSSPSIGDTYSVYRGCDRRGATCKTVFNNYDNFRGFPFNVDPIQLVKGPE